MIERTDDADYIRAIVTHPRVWPWVSEAEDRQSDYKPDLDGTVYLRCDGGYFSFRPFTRTHWEIHVCLLPKVADAKGKALAAIGWMRENGIRGFVAKIPARNRHAIRLAKSVGFRQTGKISRCVSAGGRMWDMVLMELQNG